MATNLNLNSRFDAGLQCVNFLSHGLSLQSSQQSRDCVGTAELDIEVAGKIIGRWAAVVSSNLKTPRLQTANCFSAAMLGLLPILICISAPVDPTVRSVAQTAGVCKGYCLPGGDKILHSLHHSLLGSVMSTVKAYCWVSKHA